MFIITLFVITVILLINVDALKPVKSLQHRNSMTLRAFTSFEISELYASPVARYFPGGALVSDTIKEVEAISKPTGYVYGDVSNDAIPILICGMVLVSS